MSDIRKDPNWNPRMRNKGNPNARLDTRQPNGQTNVAPAQGKSVPSPRFRSARYRLGSPIRPTSIAFDNGFLDQFKPRKPTASDYLALAKWNLKLSAAENLELAPGICTAT